MTQATRKKNEASPDEVFRRLVALNDEIDRKLEQQLRVQGITWEQFQSSAERVKEIPENQREKLAFLLDQVMPEPDKRFERIRAPEPESISARGIRLLRI